MKLHPVYNSKLGQWRICHDQPCERGDTSIVATITTGFDGKSNTFTPEQDAKLAREICDRFNTHSALQRALNLALVYMSRFEPGDSRAVSDEFVAMAAVSIGNTSPEVIAVIDAALAAAESA